MPPGESTKWDNACRDKLRGLIDAKLVNPIHTNPVKIRPYYTLDPVFAIACPKIDNFAKNFKIFFQLHMSGLALCGLRRRGEESTQRDAVLQS